MVHAMTAAEENLFGKDEIGDGESAFSAAPRMLTNSVSGEVIVSPFNC